VPVGTAFVFPVVNSFTCVDPGAPDPGEEALREQVAFVETSATDLTATIDGVPVRNVAAYYEDSEVSSWRSPADNPFGDPARTAPAWTPATTSPRRAPALTLSLWVLGPSTLEGPRVS
jgi:hypothetical protein